ncbi:MAG: hypothetical protein HWE27_00335 [Gammaproteobacteria bacterium]|nr:hypothetical protein [Gammaproteobacteria bacterium]
MKHLLKAAVIVALFSSAPTLMAKKSGFDAGIAYDMELGITAQYKGFTFFVSGDALAFDYRIENFYNRQKTVVFYIDGGAFIEEYNGNNPDRDDRVGLRLPLGIGFGLARDLEAYIQAVPSIDFSNDEDFDVDGALGVRYRF